MRYIADDVEERDGDLVRYVMLGGRRVARLDRAPGAPQPETTASLDLGYLGWSFALLMPFGLLLVRRDRRVAFGFALLLGCSSSNSGLVRGDNPVDEWPEDGVLYLADYLGSTTALADATGVVASRTSYHPYGSVRGADGEGDVFGYVGNERDTGSGLGDFDARPYRHEAGMFLGVDPLALRPGAGSAREASLYAYGYSEGSPTTRSDPDGRCSAPAGLKKGETGVCVEQFIAAKRVGGVGLGDHRGFDGDNAALSSRVQIDLRIDPKSGAVNHSARAGKSEVLFKGAGRVGKLNYSVTNLRTHMNGAHDFLITSEAYNGFYGLPGAPKGAIDMSLEIRVHPDGVVDILPGSTKDAYPSFGIYSYRDVNGQTQIDTLHEGSETNIKELKTPMNADIPATSNGKDDQ